MTADDDDDVSPELAASLLHELETSEYWREILENELRRAALDRNGYEHPIVAVGRAHGYVDADGMLQYPPRPVPADPLDVPQTRRPDPRPARRLGSRIRMYRFMRGLRITDLAPRIDVSPTALGRMERGLRAVTALEARRIATELEVPIARLLPPDPPA